MSNGGSEAVRLDYMQTANTREQRVAAPSWEVIPGGGLDARARRGVSPEFVRALRLAVALVVALVLVGGARVALSAATVSALETTQTLQSKVSEAQDTNDALQIERSVDASSQRIVRIATENYGMVRASSVDDIALVPMPTAAEACRERAQGERHRPRGQHERERYCGHGQVRLARAGLAMPRSDALGGQLGRRRCGRSTQDQSDTVDRGPETLCKRVAAVPEGVGFSQRGCAWRIL